MTNRFPPLRSQHQIDTIPAARPMPFVWMSFGLCLAASGLLLLALI